MENEQNLQKLKEKYSSQKEKYNLPDFYELNKEFQIEKLSDIETDFLLREIRMTILDRLFSYLRFIESILTPHDAPMFVFAITKTLGNNEKEKLISIYKKLARLEIDVFELNLDYNESKEAETILFYNNLWKEIKKDLLEVVKVIRQRWDSQEKEDSKGYFG